MKFVISQLAYMMKQPLHRANLGRLSRLIVIMLALVAVFTVLFHVLMVREGQDHSWLSGLYWTLVTMSTLGFGDITFQSDLGRAFTILVLVTGIFMLLIVLPFAFIRFFYAPWMEAEMKLRAPRAVGDGVKDHVVICTHDPIAADLRERLRLAHIPHVVLEVDPVAANFAVRVPDKLVGKTLAESDVGALAGVNVIAVQQDGEIHTAPSPQLPLPSHAELLLVGTHEQRLRFARAFG